MKTQRNVPFVDTSIIPDRNAGIGSLLWDLGNAHDFNRDGALLLEPAFAFIDVGVSRAKASTALKTLLVSDLKMDVDYVATERLQAVPYAYVTLLGDRAEGIRKHLSGMIGSQERTYRVTNWHYVVDCAGKVSSVAYSYHLYGNEVWESYFMGRTFMVSGETVEFADPKLDAMLAPDVRNIEAKIDLERERDSDPSRLGPSWDGYRIENNPLEAGLGVFAITLQKTDVPERIKGKQNILFIGNVLNHYPQGDQARELDRIAANMVEGDIVIVQTDDEGAASIEVLQVTRQGRERVRWIDTRTLEVQQRVRGSQSWQRIHVRPVVERMVSGLFGLLVSAVSSPDGGHEDHRYRFRQAISHVFGTYFRALPVEETLRIAIREAVRRLPSERGPKGVPVFQDDAVDAYGGAPGSELGPVVAEADLIHLGLSHARRVVDRGPEIRRRKVHRERSQRNRHR